MNERKAAIKFYGMLDRRKCGRLLVFRPQAADFLGSWPASARGLCRQRESELENHCCIRLVAYFGSPILGME
ncbi:hypothetical protein D3C81_1838150 [compost metagenome]